MIGVSVQMSSCHDEDLLFGSGSDPWPVASFCLRGLQPLLRICELQISGCQASGVVDLHIHYYDDAYLL